MARTDTVLHSPSDPLARALGWFSIGLGVVQVAAPGWLARGVGVSDGKANLLLVRAVGGRELATGAGIQLRPRPRRWLWARVGGDALDLALLGAALGNPRTDRRRLTIATGAVAGVTALDLLATFRRASRPTAGEPTMRARTAITINRPVDDVYRYWRDFKNLPSFMAHLDSVEVTGERQSHWVAHAPAGRSVQWDAEITDDTPGERIAWRSLDGADVANSGSVEFAPAPRGQGTEVTVELEYEPPGGKLGAAVAKLFGEEPLQQVKDDLRRCKQVLETGEVLRSDGTPDGTKSVRQLEQRPAQPLAPTGSAT